MSLEEGSLLGGATVIDSTPGDANSTAEHSEGMPNLRWIQTKPTAWRQRLLESLGTFENLTTVQQQKLLSFLKEHHQAFALEEGD